MTGVIICFALLHEHSLATFPRFPSIIFILVQDEKFILIFNGKGAI